MTGTVNQSIMPLTARINDNNHLEIGGMDTVELAELYGTPLYVYDEDGIRTICRQYKDAFSSYKNMHIAFASKAFMTKSMCCILKSEGIGLDVVSGGELFTAIKSNFPMENIYFNGNNKSSEELEMAIDNKVGRITVDSFLELALLDSIAKSKNVNVNILLRITPGIECHTHEYIQTGHLDSKFGFDLTQLDEVIELITQEYTNLNLKGLHAHIGSQIFETRIYHDLVGIILEQFVRIKDKFNLSLDEMNIGGGLGVKYTDEDAPPSTYDLAKVILGSLEENIKKYNIPAPKLIVEPGRSLICSSGVTLYTIGGFKQVPNATKYVTIDGGMSDNPRPSMYQAKYQAILANKANDKPAETVTVAGRFCESGDILIRNIELPESEPGDILCVFATGAYNYSMASNYNRVQKPAAILVQNRTSDVIIERESYEDIISMDRIPERLSC